MIRLAAYVIAHWLKYAAIDFVCRVRGHRPGVVVCPRCGKNFRKIDGDSRKTDRVARI